MNSNGLSGYPISLLVFNDLDYHDSPDCLNSPNRLKSLNRHNSMKKLFTALTFGAGAVFGMLFSTKKGEVVRKQLASKRSTEGKAEVIGKEAKELAQNFWKTVKVPMKKMGEVIQKDMERYTKQYSDQAKDKIDDWKKKAEKEITVEIKRAKLEVKKAVKKGKQSAKKAVSTARKTVKKKVNTAKKSVAKKRK